VTLTKSNHMADISMCHGTNCPKRDECWRHVAPRSKHWQSFFVTPPFKSVEPFECEYYLV
jgi:hypothetical protein